MMIAASVGVSAVEPVFPGATWAVRKPEAVGIETAGLDRFRDAVGGRGCVVRHGYLVYTWGDAAKRGDVASAAKPLFTHFLLKALEDGKINSLDETVLPLEPRLGALNAALGHKDRGITWRHLANQTSCYGVSEAPGAAYCYNDWQMSLFWDLLFLKVYRTTYEKVDEEVLHPLLTDLLGCEDDPTLMAFGTGDRAGRLGISPRDFARFGLLYLHRGNWGGRQLLGEKLAQRAVTSPLPNDLPQSSGKAAEMLPGQRTMGSRNVPDNQTDHFGSYSWLWWTNGIDRQGTRHWPDAPVDLFGCFGHGGPRVMAVMPGLDLIVSWNDAGVKSREAENEAFRRLVAAVVDGTN
jgi:CubicO group peptidase (beta-lactamase class C family)